MKGVKAILLMGGEGKRFGGAKQFELLCGKPLYQWTLERLKSSSLFEEILLVCPAQHASKISEAIPGGATRQASSLAGLKALSSDTEIVVIHDGVRPFVTERILKENILAARAYGAVDTCIPSTDTLVYAPTGSKIDAIPERSAYLRGQTPQSFSYPLILEAHEKTSQTNASDDCQLVLEMGHPVHIVMGEPSNLKVTTPFDLKLAELLMKQGSNPDLAL